MSCPCCGDDDSITITATVTMDVQLCEDGTDDDGGGDREWDDNSDAECGYCDWKGTAGQLSTAYKAAHKASREALGRDATDEEIALAFSSHNRAIRTGEKMRVLFDLRKQLKEARLDLHAKGGRGIHLAEKVDQLEIAVAVISTLKKLTPHVKMKPSNGLDKINAGVIAKAEGNAQ